MPKVTPTKPVPQGHKWCNRCKDARPIEAFGKQRSSPDGRTSRCSACIARKARERYLIKKILADPDHAYERSAEELAAERAWVEDMARRLGRTLPPHLWGDRETTPENTMETESNDTTSH